MKFPTCHCGQASKLSAKPQGRELFERGEDFYCCKAGHEFIAKVPLDVAQVNGALYGVRADM